MRALVLMLALLVSCAPRLEPSAERSDEALPCDVDEVLQRRCRTCHGETPSFGAPMSLVELGRVRASAIASRIADNSMPPRPNAPLSGADRAVVDGWLKRGMPGGDRCATKPSGGPPPVTLGCKTDVSVRPAAPHAVSSDSGDVYVCYGFDPKVAAKRHVIGIAPRVDATAVVHHVTLLMADSAVDPTPASCPIAGSSTWRSVFGWAPGGNGLELPKEAGFPLDESSHYVVQIHYSNATHRSGLTDASGFDLCTTSELRPNDADVMAFGTHNFTIPPRADHDLTCTVAVPSYGATTHLFAAYPHMHLLGTSISTVVQTPDGETIGDLGAQPKWDFGNQTWLPIDFVLRPGDVVKTRCAWRNTTDSYVTFGEKTTDEMCYSFVMYYPRIEHPAWSWASPAVSSVCSPTR